MKTTSTSLIFLFFTSFLLSQVKERIYFDLNWEKTTKDRASYYRDLPLEEKENMVLIKDYYLSGAIQFIGWAKKNNEDILLKEVKWFYENGNLKRIGYYLENNIGDYGLHNKYKEYYENGTIYKELNYFIGRLNGKANYYNEQGYLMASCIYEYDQPIEGTTNCFSTYKNGKLIEKKLFYENTKQIAYKEYNDMVNMYNSHKINYKKNGKILKEKQVKFYPSNKCGYVIGIKHIKDSLRGYSLPSDEELFFDKKGEILYKGTNKYGRHFNGSFFFGDTRLSTETEHELYYIKTYKEGEIQNLKTYLKDSIFTDGDFIKGKPYNGTFQFVRVFKHKQCSVVFTLKNGKKEGKESFYSSISNIKTNNVFAYFNYKNGKKEGESNTNCNSEYFNFKMFYKNDKPHEGTLENERNIIKYKDGKVVMTKKLNSYKNYYYYEIYEKGVKTGIEYLFLDNNGKEIEPGIFKNGKPFYGYFFNTKTKNTILDYYKNGLKKANRTKKLKEII